VRDMRRKIALLTTSTLLSLCAAVVVASPAQARNIGGLTGECLAPGAAVLGEHGSTGAGLGANCVCVVSKDNHQDVLAGPSGPGSECPPGILSRQAPKG
jgi:hypothetical protein